MATLNQVKVALKNAADAGDNEAATKLAAIASRALSAGVAPDAELDNTVITGQTPEEPGLIDSVKEAFTGEQRATEETETLPSIQEMPEFNGWANQLSLRQLKTGLGTLLTNPEETIQIIKSNYPNIQARQDAKGNYILKSEDQKEYALKPGAEWSDLPRVLAGLAAWTPAGRAATTIPKALGSAALTQSVIEGTQAATGGEFNPEDVAMAAAAGGAGTALVQGGRAVVNAARAPISQAINKFTGVAEKAQQATQAAPIEPAAVQAAQQATQAAPTQNFMELAGTTRKAAGGSNRALDVLAGEAAPDPKVLEAAKRLGIEDYLQPDHVTTNQAYREIAQAVKSVPGSSARSAEIEGLAKVAKRADDLIEEIGGSGDLAGVSQNVKQSLQKTQSELEKRANKLYTQLREGIAPKTTVQADNVLDFIKTRGDDLGGEENLSSLERMVTSKLEGSPTYALLDEVRKDIGSAARMAGPFKDANTGLAKKLYSLISKDQEVVAKTAGLDDVFQAAKSAVSVRKGVEDDLVALFGKNLDGSIVRNLAGAVRVLPTGDTSKFIKLIKSIPEDMREEVVASGLLTSFGHSAKRGQISFQSFATWYEGILKNKQAHAAIMTNLPKDARKKLGDLYRVSKGIGQASKERIQTGRLNAVTEELKGADNFAAKVFGPLIKGTLVAGASKVGGPGAGMAVASVMGAGGKSASLRAADALITSPEFLQAVKMVGTGNVKQASKKLATAKAFKNFMEKIKGPTELSERERWIVQAFEAQSSSNTSGPQ